MSRMMIDLQMEHDKLLFRAAHFKSKKFMIPIGHFNE